MRGLVIELTASVIGSPVASSAWTICAAGTSGSFERRSAMAPATCGAAAEVPSAVAQPLPGTDEVMETPGASRATIGPSSVNGASASGVVVVEAPTATALLMQAGAPTPMWLEIVGSRHDGEDAQRRQGVDRGLAQVEVAARQIEPG